MALGVRYRGSFLSKEGIAWRVDILQEGYGGTQPGELNFPSSGALEIEWGETDKLDPVQGSCATINIISDRDRQYIDLYTVQVGEIRIEIYRNGVLYWTGSLDPELYEEPYSFTDGYDVSLTFSDFACLDRFDWIQTGRMTIHGMIVYCLGLCGMDGLQIQKLISTKLRAYSSSPITLEEIHVNQENFYDEDGKSKTAREVLEAILKPFGLRIIQKAGKIYIYDLNALYGQTASAMEWGFSDDAVLGVDKVYNNVKLTFSPYGDAEMMKGTVEEDPALADTGTLIHQNYHRNDYNVLDSLQGFRICYGETHKSNMEISNGAKFFQMSSIYSGQDETGVIASFKLGDAAVAEEDGASSSVRQQLITPRDCGTITGGNVNSVLLVRCPRVFLGNVSYLKQNYRLRINLDLLFDVRYNPFESEGDYNDNAAWYNGLFNWTKHDGPYQNMQDWCNFGYVPIKLTLEDEAGNALYHYENRSVLDSNSCEQTGARWVSGAASWGHAYLCYYDSDDRKSKSGFGGWKTNKQIIGYYRDELPEKWKSLDDGEYIPLPPGGGYLVLEIGSGIHQFDYKREVKNIYKFCRWIAYKEPSITLCKKNYKEAETEDVEDMAWLNISAKEELEFETILGTLPQNHGVPNAKGQLFDVNNEAYSMFARAGIEDRLERLLIGTIYSQYATRHDTLSGTAKLLPSFGIYTERATAGKFMLLSEVQKCKTDESVVKMCVLTEEEYQGIEYSEE